MLTAYAHRSERLEALDATSLRDAVWIDLLDPDETETRRVEEALGLHLPTQEDMEEIELSSRLYQEDDARFMTLTGLFGLEGDLPHKTPLSFVLKDGRLISIRYADFKTFTGYSMRATRSNAGRCETGKFVLFGLLEAMIDRLADALEKVGGDIDRVSHEIFRRRVGREKAQGRDLETLIGRIGREGEIIDMIQESMLSLARVVNYLGTAMDEHGHRSGEARDRAASIQRDADQLGEHAVFLSEKVTFLLDAALGLISIEQNKVMKIFSIVAVVFMPPTLVASTYGMNFERMPELQWAFGYPFALLLMVIFAVGPFLFFKSKGWL